MIKVQTSAYLLTEKAAYENTMYCLRKGLVISNRTAKTIASWFHGPSPRSMPFHSARTGRSGSPR